MADRKKYRGFLINAPAIKVAPLNNADHQRYLFHNSVAQTQEGFGDLKRQNYNNGLSRDSGYSNRNIAHQEKWKARDLIDKHVTRELKRKGTLQGKKDVIAYHTTFTSSPAVQWRDRSGKRKAYVNVKGL